MLLSVSLISNFRICLIVLAGLLLTACSPNRIAPEASGWQPGEQSIDWKPADVRLIDEIDAPAPEMELAVLYTRSLGNERRVRLDFLELAVPFSADLLLEIDHQPGGIPAETNARDWDIRVELPSQGNVQVLQAGGSEQQDWVPLPGAAVRVVRDTETDSIEISLKEDTLGNFSPGTYIRACVLVAGSQEELDCTLPTTWEGGKLYRLPVLMAFTNSYPAFTPSQALRRWDGAHSGPLGGRHGLYNLLRTARSHQVELVLLDLSTPESLSALEYQGGLDLVRQMQSDRLLTLALPLPASSQPMPGWMVERFLLENQQAASQADLDPVPFVYMPGQSPPATELAGQEDHLSGKETNLASSRLSLVEGRIIFDLPGYSDSQLPSQATPDGLSLEWRERLVRLAGLLNHPGMADPDPLLLLGGSLPESTWGHPESARATFRYLQAHPWIRLAGAADLQAGRQLLYFKPSQSSPVSTADFQPAWLVEGLRTAPLNALGEAAWDAYRAAFLPVFPRPDQLETLRAGYLRVVGRLLTAARWAQQPTSISSCATDTDQDGSPECLLATQTAWADFEPGSGNLASLFFTCNETHHQASGSTAQLISGLGEPMNWIMNEGQMIDPAVIDGALAGPAGPYQAELAADRLVMTSADGRITKSYQLLSDGVWIEIQAQFPGKLTASMVFPLILDPWVRFQWTAEGDSGLDAYQLLPHTDSDEASNPGGTSNEITWRTKDGSQVSLRFNGEFTVRSFQSSRPYLGQPENPNFAYPPGHYDPFPLAVIEFHPGNSLTLQLVFGCEKDQ